MRRLLVTLLFAALIGAAVVLGQRVHRPAPAGDAAKFGFQLREVSRELGIDFVHRAPKLDPKIANIEPHVAGMGASVSVADADGDGRFDLYATSSDFGAPNALFQQQPDGKFRDVAASAGAADLNRPGTGVSMGSVWGDFDGDGDEDLFVSKWGSSVLLRNDTEKGSRQLRFSDVTERAGMGKWMNANGAVWLDYDRDGRLDLYVAGYFREEIDLWNLRTTEIMQESFEYATNGGHNRLWHNLGDGRFEEVAQAIGADSTRWTLAVSSGDFDGDGWPDLYLANDYGPEELFLNRGGKRFELQSAAAADAGSKSGMSVALGDVRNQGRVDVYVTNISKRGFLFQGNNLRLNDLHAGRLRNVAEGDVADCGWAWGAQFGDLNNDGRQDLFVVNGFISADRTRDYWYDMSKVSAANTGLFRDAKNWAPIGDRSLSGYERSRVLFNTGDGFLDVAEAVGATDDLDGRAIALADLGNRGALDVIVANQKQRLLVYRNDVDPRNHWVALELEGADGNTSAIGAHVALEFGGRKQVQVVDGGGGFCSQNQRRLHFGLGRDAVMSKATIRWPSGRTQEIGSLAPDRLHRIEEPRS